MNNEVKETNLTLRVRNYNGDYGIGSVFVEEFKLNVKQLANNSSNQDGLVIFTANTGFCCNLNLGANQLASIKTEIPFVVKNDKLNTFNEMVEKIKNDPNYKYNESHYANDKFDPKRLEYFDIIIDGEEFESNDDSVFSTLLHDVINVEEITALMDEYYQKLTQVMKKANKPSETSTAKVGSINDERIDNVLSQISGDEEEKNLLRKLIKKIDLLQPNTETTIANLMQLDNSGVAMVDPLSQGKVFNNLMKVCEVLNIKIEVNHDEIGGLGYHYKFKKLVSSDKKEYSQDELKELFYRAMNENEAGKLKELGMDDEIAKLTTPTHQIKYFDGIGYVLIGDGYIIQANGMEQQRYFATIVNSPEEAKQEILNKLR